jgi:hypothetical protein
MPDTIDDEDWDTLLSRIREGRCTPFLGAGVNHGILPLGSELARELAEQFNYPFDDCQDLVRVTQFMAIKRDAVFPKEKVRDLLKGHLEQWEKTVTLADFFDTPDQPLGVLADLPLPVYMTTNYDNLMCEALQSRQKDPKREFCRWNKHVRDKPSVFDSAAGFDPTPANPVVFHLHGHDELIESLVLTEDDYLDFLVNISRQQDLLPLRIQEALTGSSLLFVGYRLADWDFRVLFRGLVDSLEKSLWRISLAVQLEPEATTQQSRQAQQEFLVKYFGKIRVLVYFGTAQQFAAELRERWRRFTHGR